MNFGVAPAELMPGANNAVETCLAVRSNEHVALIADEASRSVAASLAAALDALLADEAAYASWTAHFGPPPPN